MNIQETRFCFLKNDCVERFGAVKGDSIYTSADRLYKVLLAGADYRDNDEIKEHMQQNIFTTMAYYKTLLTFNFGREEALGYVREESAKNAGINREKYAKLAKLPLSYLLFRLGVKPVMNKSYPKEGWDIDWVDINAGEIHFDMKSCIYKEMCDKHGCPELCTVFCENDPIAFSGLEPKIRFERSQTLGTGGDRCDFHFYKN